MAHHEGDIVEDTDDTDDTEEDTEDHQENDKEDLFTCADLRTKIPKSKVRVFLNINIIQVY